jgi:hypothetical protein
VLEVCQELKLSGASFAVAKVVLFNADCEMQHWDFDVPGDISRCHNGIVPPLVFRMIALSIHGKAEIHALHDLVYRWAIGKKAWKAPKR